MIPPILHRAWFGPPIPEHLEANFEKWRRHHPEYLLLTWTEARLPRLENQALFNLAPEITPDAGTAGQLQADIARLEILHRYGGIWVDCDLEPQRSIDELRRQPPAGSFDRPYPTSSPHPELLAAWETPGRWINTALLGSEAGHPFLEHLIDTIPKSLARHSASRPNIATGPQLFTRETWREQPDIWILNKPLIYPYRWDELDRHRETFPDAYTIHHWNHKRQGRAPGATP